MNRIVTFAMACVFALAVSACGGGSGSPEEPAPPVVPVPAPPVTPAPPSAAPFTLLPARLQLTVGGDAGLLALRAPGPVTWSSSNPAVASVDAQGQVTALAPGTATVSGTANGLVNGNSAPQVSTAAVKVHDVAAATAGALINAAVAQGRISTEEALTYRVFARFGDPRLPAEFDGAPPAAPGHGLMREVAGRMATLTVATQATLQPFLLPPIYTESWAAQQMGAAAPVAAARVGPREGALLAAGAAKPLAEHTVNCRTADNPTVWLRRSTAHFNIHYPDQGPNELAGSHITEAVAAVVEEAYESLTGLLQRFPLPDGAERCNGGDGAVDIYLDYFMPQADLAATVTYNGCNGVPSYITLNSSHPFFRREVAQLPADANVRRGVKAVLAHEIAHVLQFAMLRPAACGDTTWLDEAIAEWAMDHVDPTLDRFEDGYTKLRSPLGRNGGFLLRYLSRDHMAALEKPGADEDPAQHGYAEYLFFQYLARRFGGDVIKQVFDAQAGLASVEAVASALAVHGGMKAVWPDFAQTLWIGRTQQVLDYWVSTDRYDYGLANIFEPAAGDGFAQSQGQLKTLQVEQRSQPRASFKLFERTLVFPGDSYEIEPRSLHYEHLKFSDASVHSVLLVNPIAVLPNRDFIKLQVVKKIGGAWQAAEDWTTDPTRSLCLDRRDERVEELLLIVSNSEVNRGAEQPFRIPKLLPMRLSTSNVGCWKWTGTASTETSYDDGSLSGVVKGSGVVQFEATVSSPGRVIFEPRNGFIDAQGSGRLGQCTFTDVVDRKVLSREGLPDGKLYVNLDLLLADIGEPPDRQLAALDGLAAMNSTRTMACPGSTVSSSGQSYFTWLQVDEAPNYAVSADGRTIEGEYIANFPATRSAITTRFKFRAERE